MNKLYQLNQIIFNNKITYELNVKPFYEEKINDDPLEELQGINMENNHFLFTKQTDP